MSEFAGPESWSPDEGTGKVSEKASEAAREQFRASQAQGQQMMREEKKAKRRDDGVAKIIRQFLSDERYAHLFQLISRLAARDCPSIFILALLSLIHQPSREAVEEYIRERNVILDLPASKSMTSDADHFSLETKGEILLWISRLSLVMSTDTERVLSKLMIDEDNIDGNVLQLATFVLVEFFVNIGKAIPFQELQPLTIKILQDVIEPHMETMQRYFESMKEGQGETSEDE